MTWLPVSIAKESKTAHLTRSASSLLNDSVSRSMVS
ncbi:hypothetical protein ACHAXS_002676, partial [Conticribra weissflogii]